MRGIKYIAGSLIIALLMMLIGEMYIWNAENFQTEYPTTRMYLPSDSSQTEMIDEITSTASNFDCKLFVISRDVISLRSIDITIYGMEGIEGILSKDSSIKVGNYESVFAGKLHIQFKSLDEIPDVNDVDCYYIAGHLDDIRSFKSATINKYGGGFPKEGYTSFHASSYLIIFWCIGLTFLLLLTLFETTLLQKEMTVRFVYGERLSSIVIHRVISDILYFGAYFVAVWCFLKYILHAEVEYMIEYSAGCFVAFLTINSLLYTRLMFIDYKFSLKRGNGNKTVLTTSYFFKTFTLMLITIVVSMCVESISLCASYWNQNKFFQEHKNASYIAVATKDLKLESASEFMLEFYNKKMDEGRAFLNVKLCDGPITDRPCLMFNKFSLDYLKDCIPELINRKVGNGLYFIIPQKDSIDAATDLEFVTSQYITGETQSPPSYELIYYSSTIPILGIDRTFSINSQYYENPLIILDMSSRANYALGYHIVQCCMLEADSSEWDIILSDSQIAPRTSYITNVYSNYENTLHNYQRLLYLSLVLLLILFLLEFIVIRAIIQYECILNSMELAVKTILGYSYFEKYIKVVILTFISGIVGAIISFALSSLLDHSSMIYSFMGWSLVFTIDLALIIRAIGRMERKNITKTLKGSSI